MIRKKKFLFGNRNEISLLKIHVLIAFINDQSFGSGVSFTRLTFSYMHFISFNFTYMYVYTYLILMYPKIDQQ